MSARRARLRSIGWIAVALSLAELAGAAEGAGDRVSPFIRTAVTALHRGGASAARALDASDTHAARAIEPDRLVWVDATGRIQAFIRVTAIGAAERSTLRDAGV